jgi:glutamate carboxypeptidase
MHGTAAIRDDRAVTAIERLRGAQDDMLIELGALVACESPSDDLDATRRCADLFSEMAVPYLSVEAERVVVDGRCHLRWEIPGSGPRPVLLLGHLDTVWPLGSLEDHPFEVAGGRATGPGCFDMKAGLVQMLHAVGELREPAPPLTVLVTSDEEIGSPSSRALIEHAARHAVAALVCEPSESGRLKSARKGVSLYEIEITGRAAHAGLEPHKGVNASIELARQVLAIDRLGDPQLGTTVTPTVLSAGTVSNVVPARGRICVDARAATPEEQARVDHAMRALAPVLPEAQLALRGGPNRPPMPASASSALVVLAAVAAEAIGLGSVGHVHVGGGSDGNFTAGVGTPTLDGLGAVGGGAHADHEHVLVDAMPERAALLAELIVRIGAAGSEPAERVAAPVGSGTP